MRILKYENSHNSNSDIYSSNVSYPCNSYEEPLKKAINSFFSFSEEDVKKQKDLTIKTIKLLES